jgi:(p)ppGpp synthase/HD superfamily hydrolase
MEMVMTRYQKLEISLRYYLLGARYHTALKAMDFARKIHTGFRKDGITPEFQHQIEIALFITTLKDIVDEERTIVVGLLHDTIEDYVMSAVELKQIFGESVFDCCQLLNKKGKLSERYFESIEADPTASIVKGADRIHNVNSMVGVFTKEKQREYIEETKKYFIPMLKNARNFHPAQMQAYFNIMHMLRSQLNLLGE